MKYIAALILTTPIILSGCGGGTTHNSTSPSINVSSSNTDLAIENSASKLSLATTVGLKTSYNAQATITFQATNLSKNDKITVTAKPHHAGDDKILGLSSCTISGSQPAPQSCKLTLTANRKDQDGQTETVDFTTTSGKISPASLTYTMHKTKYSLTLDKPTTTFTDTKAKAQSVQVTTDDPDSISLTISEAGKTYVDATQCSALSKIKPCILTIKAPQTKGDFLYTVLASDNAVASSSGYIYQTGGGHKPDPLPPLPQTVSGQIIYHFAQDPAGNTVFPYTASSPTFAMLDLSKSNFSTVIMTNIIAGVVMGDLLHTKWPNMKFNRDYVYGSLLGQIFQEDNSFGTCHTPNSSQLQNNSTNCTLTSIMSTGGPYQINSYQMAVVQPSAATKSSGLYSYAALASNLGFKQGEHPAQAPASFNDTYFGPMISAYFHYMQALNLYGIQNPEYQPAQNKQIIDKCFGTLSSASAPTNETNLFDLVLNNAYNAGENTETFKTYVKDCSGIINDPTRSYDYSYLLDPANYTEKTGISSANSMYANYPRQVRVYLDQIFNNDNPGVPAPRTRTSLPYKLDQMQAIFSDVMQQLSYFKDFQNISVNVGGSTLNMKYGYNIKAIDQKVIADAFTAAMKHENSTYTQDTKLNLGDATQRGVIFNILEGAIKNINTALTKKSAIRSPEKNTEDIFSQDISPAPACIDDNTIEQYVPGKKYAVGDLMKQKSFAFRCKQAGWCGAASYNPLTAAKASDWQAAWALVPNVTGNTNGYDCSKVVK